MSMKYKEAFSIVFNRYGDNVLSDIFIFRSMMLDLIGESYLDNDLLNAFLLLNPSKLYSLIRALPLKDAKLCIEKEIDSSDKCYSILQYNQSIEPLLLFLYPDVHQEITPTFSTKKNVNKKLSNKIKIRKRKSRSKKKDMDTIETIVNGASNTLLSVVIYNEKTISFTSNVISNKGREYYVVKSRVKDQRAVVFKNSKKNSI